MRGHQVGDALGARVTSTPYADDWRWADVAILIKRAGRRWASVARAHGVPVVWDALDFWRQPADNGIDEPAARALLAEEMQAIQPALAIGATQAMADACGGVYIPHHSWKGLEPIQAREGALVVAYQGNPLYLGAWKDRIKYACQRRGWVAALNPEQLWAADIIIALRDGPWDGWICRQWKSGVKLVNAIAAGRPVITQASAAFAELNPPGSVIESPEGLDAALDAWADLEARRRVVEECRALAPALRLPAVADRYRTALAHMGVPCIAS